MRTTTHPGLDNKDKNNAVNHTFRHTSADKLVTVMATPEKSHRKKTNKKQEPFQNMQS